MKDSNAEKLQPLELDDKAVKDYLMSNPDFFNRHPGLLSVLYIPHQQKGSVSLVERQAEQLRRQVSQLQDDIQELMDVAKHNENIYRIYADLNLQLCKCDSLESLQKTLEQALLKELGLPAVSLKLYQGENGLPEIQRRGLEDKRFGKEVFYFGRMSQAETQIFFAQPDIESVALIQLGEHQELGILAIGSDEAGHFHPDMDTLLITQLRQFLNMLLGKLLSAN